MCGATNEHQSRITGLVFACDDLKSHVKVAETLTALHIFKIGAKMSSEKHLRTIVIDGKYVTRLPDIILNRFS